MTAAREPDSRSSLVLQTWLTEMHLCVDHAWQNMEAGAVDAFAGIARDSTDCSDAAIADADISTADAILVDDGAAA